MSRFRFTLCGYTDQQCCWLTVSLDGVWFLWLFFFCYPCQCLSWCWPPICPPGCGNSRGMESEAISTFKGIGHLQGQRLGTPPSRNLFQCAAIALWRGNASMWLIRKHSCPAKQIWLSLYFYFIFLFLPFHVSFILLFKKSFWAEPSRVLAAWSLLGGEICTVNIIEGSWIGHWSLLGSESPLKRSSTVPPLY